MFKRIFIAGFMFLLMLFFCIFCFISSSNATKTLITDISKIKENINKNKIDLALKDAEEFEKKWDQKGKNFSMFMDHIKIEAIDQSISCLIKNLEIKRLEDAYIETGRIEKFLEHIKNSENVNFSNVL